jgi:DNA end-binding protein Ku
VKLYSAVSKQTVRFRELREGDGARVRHKRVAESDGKEVPYEQIVKGYEFAPEEYVLLGKDELAELDPKKTGAIEIKDFVDLDQIDPIYFDHPYYLGPDKGAAKAYALLVRSMREAGKVAIARFVLRNKEHLAAIRPMGDVLTLATMHFHDEVAEPSDIDEVFGEKPGRPDARELKMATQLIESLSADFRPQSYHDEYREELLELLEKKAAGEDVVRVPSEEPKPTKAPDLMAALEESLAAVKAESKGNGAAKPAKKKAPARAAGAAKRKSAPAKPKPKSKPKAKAAK